MRPASRAIERILSAQGRPAARQTQHQWRERKNEKSPDDNAQDRRSWSNPGPRAADTSQITELTSCPQKPPM
jgi:hypothetical protein